MSLLYLHLPILLGIFTITEQYREPSTEVEKILDYLNQRSSNRDPSTQTQNLNYYGHQSDNGQDIPNVRNIESLNLYHNDNNLKDKKELDDDLEKHLRLVNDRICRTTGRCGCSGGRCGGPRLRDDSTVNYIEQLLQDLDKNLNREQNGKNWFDDDKDDDQKSPVLKRIDNKQISNDDLDIVFLEAPDSEDKQLISRLRNLDDVKVVDLRNIDLQNLFNNPNIFDKGGENIQRSLDAVTLQDLGAYFEEGKREIIKTLFDNIKRQKNNPYIAHLSPYQNREINTLKASHSQNPLTDVELRAKIVKIIFGASSNIKILSQSKDDNFYIPQKIYNSILAFKKKKDVRTKKNNIFPLTLQQKERIQNKIDKKIIPNHSWRRNIQEQPKYGAPFQLEVQGLGQIN